MCNCKCNKSLIGWIGLVMCGLFEKANNFLWVWDIVFLFANSGSIYMPSCIRIIYAQHKTEYKRCVLCALWYYVQQ